MNVVIGRYVGDPGLKASFCKRRIGATVKNRHGRLTTLDEALGMPLRFAAKRIENRALPILATTLEPQRALEACKKRWAIERFGDVETRGFDLEDTRFSNPAQLDTLFVPLALAVAWAAKTADILVGKKHRKTKSHGYLATSYFRIGFDQLRNSDTSSTESCRCSLQTSTIVIQESPVVWIRLAGQGDGIDRLRGSTEESVSLG